MPGGRSGPTQNGGAGCHGSPPLHPFSQALLSVDLQKAVGFLDAVVECCLRVVPVEQDALGDERELVVHLTPEGYEGARVAVAFHLLVGYMIYRKLLEVVLQRLGFERGLALRHVTGGGCELGGLLGRVEPLQVLVGGLLLLFAGGRHDVHVGATEWDVALFAAPHGGSTDVEVSALEVAGEGRGRAGHHGLVATEEVGGLAAGRNGCLRLYQFEPELEHLHGVFVVEDEFAAVLGQVAAAGLTQPGVEEPAGGVRQAKAPALEFTVGALYGELGSNLEELVPGGGEVFLGVETDFAEEVLVVVDERGARVVGEAAEFIVDLAGAQERLEEVIEVEVGVVLDERGERGDGTRIDETR